MGKKENKEKTRYFAFILYLDSIPKDWLLQLEMLDISMAISPLHDKDKNDNGDYKKPHYHVIYIAKNPVTVDAVRNRIKRKLGNNSISYVEIVESVKNYYEYLTHESKDAVAKKKHVYDKKDIVEINGFDIDRYIVLDEAQKSEILDLMIELIVHYGFKNIIDFEKFYRQQGDAYGLPQKRLLNNIIKSNTGILRLYFDGNFQTNQKQNKQKQEPEENDKKTQD